MHRVTGMAIRHLPCHLQSTQPFACAQHTKSSPTCGPWGFTPPPGDTCGRFWEAEAGAETDSGSVSQSSESYVSVWTSIKEPRYSVTSLMPSTF